MKNFMLMTLLFSSSLFAFEPKLKEVQLKKFSAAISENCQGDCMALSSIKELDAKKLASIKDKLFGGRQPGLMLCLYAFKASFKTFKDQEGNEQTYCYFKDQSYISTAEYDQAISYFD